MVYSMNCIFHARVYYIDCLCKSDLCTRIAQITQKFDGITRFFVPSVLINVSCVRHFLFSILFCKKIQCHWHCKYFICFIVVLFVKYMQRNNKNCIAILQKKTVTIYFTIPQFSLIIFWIRCKKKLIFLYSYKSLY